MLISGLNSLVGGVAGILSTESDFDPSKSPIFCMNKISVSHKNLEEVLPQLVEVVKKICTHHKADKGIVHTHTMKIAKAIQEKVSDDRRFLFRDEGITNEMILNEHITRTDKTVLVSPSLGFGTDLRDDQGRFQVIVKTPYLPLGSKRIKILAEKSMRWYQMKTLVNLVQMCGRTTRSKEDFSDTYILDNNAIRLIKQNIQHLPKWFIERVK